MENLSPIYRTDRDGGLKAPTGQWDHDFRNWRKTPGRGIDCEVSGKEFEFGFNDATRAKLAKMFDVDVARISYRILDSWTVAVLVREV